MMLRIQWLLLLLISAALSASTATQADDDADSYHHHHHHHSNHDANHYHHDDDEQRYHRRLNWDALNSIMWNAVVHLPDQELSAGGVNMKITEMKCTNMRIGDILLTSRRDGHDKVVAVTHVDYLDMYCTARYHFSGWLIVNGSGDVSVESRGNQAGFDTVFQATDFNRGPPHDSYVSVCNPHIFIQKIDFYNAGFWEFALDALSESFRQRFEILAKERFCHELKYIANDKLDKVLHDMAALHTKYPPGAAINPLGSETRLPQLGPAPPLINWQRPDSYPFGFFMDEAWRDMVAYLNQRVPLPSGQVGLNANLLLYQNILENNGLLIVDIDPAEQLLYDKHDRWFHSTIQANQVRIRGLDTMTTLNPLVVVGQYTLQSKVSWQSISLEMDLAIDVLPSRQPDAYINGGNGQGISERVTITFGLSNVNADISVLLALDQTDIEALQVGHFLQKDNILPCLLSSIHHTEVSALSVDALDLQPPRVTGFTGSGPDKLITSVIEAGFRMYEATMLLSSKSYFNTAVRQVVNEAIVTEMGSYGLAKCTLFNIPQPHGIVDAKELLLEPPISISNGFGKNAPRRYGDLFSGFVMPTLQKEVLTDDNINERFLRPYTIKQSGYQGVVNVVSPDGAPLLDFAQKDPNGTTWVSLLGWEQFQLQALGAKVRNLDTIASPVDILNPINETILANSIQTGTSSSTPVARPVQFTMRMIATATARDSAEVVVPDMSNELEFVLSIPTTQIAADFLVAMNETSLLYFPMKDLDNQFCWLAALTAGKDHPALNMERFIASISSFAVDAACVSCTSPGGEVIPAILQTMKDAGLTSSFRPYLEAILMEVVWSAWGNMNIDDMIQDAPRLCPHSPTYDVNATASDSYGASNAMVAPPEWSSQSVETMAAVGFLSGYASLFVMASNHLMQPPPELDVQTIVPEMQDSANQTAENRFPDDEIILVDWTDLSSTLFPWANDIFYEAREALTITSVSEDDDDSLCYETPANTLGDGAFNASLAMDGGGEYETNDFNATRRLNFLGMSFPPCRRRELSQILGADSESFIQNQLLNDDGAWNIELDDMQIDFAGITFSLSRARLLGIDTVTHFEPFIVVGPQSLQNNVRLQELSVLLDFEVQMDEVKSTLTVEFGFEDVAMEVPVQLAMDSVKLGQIEMGSLMRTSKMLPCLLGGAQEVYIPDLNLTFGKMDKPKISGSFSPELLSQMESISDALFDAYGSDLTIALPGIFDTTIRRTLNAWLDQFVRQVDPSFCEVEAGGGLVDFRDLFLPQHEAKDLGGSGMQQYGDVFVRVHQLMRRELETKDGKPPSFNDLLSSWTARQSGVGGSLHFPGDLMDTSANLVLAGLNATLGIKLSDFFLENMNTLGSPLALLDPQRDAHYLSNIASFGVGPDPLKLSARLMLSLTDNDEMQVQNDVNVSINVYEVTTAATVLLRIAEDAFLKFPLNDVTNFYCWISTIVASTDSLPGVALTDHDLRLQGVDLNASCNSCSSPQFGNLIADLYSPSDGEEATDTAIQTLGQILNGEAIQDFLDQFVRESSSLCPHSNDYEPDSLMTASEYLKNQGDAFGFTDFASRSESSSYFNIASAIFGAILLLCFLVGKFLVWRRNRKWKESLSNDGMYLLRRQKAKEREQEETIDMYSTSLFKSPHIPRNIRWGVPAVILVNIMLYLGGHLSVLSTVDVEVHLAGEDFTVHNFMVFTFFDSTLNTYKNGGMEMSIMLWIFTGIWPYVKTLSSLILWFVPPRLLSVSTRGKLLLWIDTLTKLSIIDIFTLILFLAVLLVYIGGPDDNLNAEGALYSMKLVVIPGAACYCIVIAQRMSRVSSRFFLEYHEQDVAAARQACARGDIQVLNKKKGKTLSTEDELGPCLDTSQLMKNEVPLFEESGSRQEEEEEKEEFESAHSEGQEVQDCEGHNYCGPVDAGDYKLPPEEHQLNVHVDKELEDAASSLSEEEKESRWCSFLVHLRLYGGHLGAAFGALTVLVLAIIGCIYAPSVSVEISDLWGLALEHETTMEEVATQYGVFTVVSAVLLKARFVLDTTWDYVALGFLLTVAGISVGMVFFVGCFHFLKRLMKEGWSAIKPNRGSSTYKLPSYLSLHAYKHIEIYVVAVVIGCWQLGSVSIYAIHLYCSILDAVYKVLTYIGLAQASSVQCFEAQMTLPDNLCIFFGSLFILIGNFCIQSSTQYKKNIQEACDLLRQEDHNAEHLSSLWNTSPSKRGFWSSSRHLQLNRTATFTEEFSTGEDSPSFQTAKSSSPIAFVPYCTDADDMMTVSTISGGSPSIGRVHASTISVGSFSGTPTTSTSRFSGSPMSGENHRIIASVDQYSTPQ